MTALRITYEITGDKVRITAVRPVTARIGQSAPESVLETGIGTWIEVRDAKGACILARVLDDDTLAGTMRTQAGDGLGTMTRVKVERLADTILVPAAPGGHVAIRRRRSAKRKVETLAEADAAAMR